MQIQTIVVPTDFSEYAEHAFNWALGLAMDRKAKIVLVHAAQAISYLAFPERVVRHAPCPVLVARLPQPAK